MFVPPASQADASESLKGEFSSESILSTSQLLFVASRHVSKVVPPLLSPCHSLHSLKSTTSGCPAGVALLMAKLTSRKSCEQRRGATRWRARAREEEERTEASNDDKKHRKRR